MFTLSWCQKDTMMITNAQVSIKKKQISADRIGLLIYRSTTVCICRCVRLIFCCFLLSDEEHAGCSGPEESDELDFLN